MSESSKHLINAADKPDIYELLEQEAFGGVPHEWVTAAQLHQAVLPVSVAISAKRQADALCEIREILSQIEGNLRGRS